MELSGRAIRVRVAAACLIAATVTGCSEQIRDSAPVGESPPVTPAERQAALPEPEFRVVPFAEVAQGFRQKNADTGQFGSIEDIVNAALARSRAGQLPGSAPVQETIEVANAAEIAGASGGEPDRGENAAALQASGGGDGQLPGQAVLAETVAAPAGQPEAHWDELSDEQDFAVVTVRDTIESAAARRQQQQQKMIVYQPAELPERQGNSNVARYALSTIHDVGTKIYSRRGMMLSQTSLRKRCNSFPDAHAAQLEFLDAGGPVTDKLGIDPDGDGFACGWTPAIYRSML